MGATTTIASILWIEDKHPIKYDAAQKIKHYSVNHT